MYKTRFKYLGFDKIETNIWRIFHLEGKPAAVGPIYHSKIELLSDIERYNKDNWGY